MSLNNTKSTTIACRFGARLIKYLIAKRRNRKLPEKIKFTFNLDQAAYKLNK